MLDLYVRWVLWLGERRSRLREQGGQGLVEYGLILVLVSIAVIGALLLVSGQLKTVFNNIVSGLQGTNP